jgi:uncharacterized protein with FMN-binding domain
MATDNQNQNPALKFITPAVAVLIIAGVAMWMNNKPATPTVTEPTPTDTNNETMPTGTETNSETPATTSYKAGSYAVTGSYQSPAGAEELGVTLTIDQNGIIQEAKTETLATNPASKKWQDTFSSGFSAQVVGKSINEVSLDIVNGSSLTPKGFNDALQKIKAQASIQS